MRVENIAYKKLTEKDSFICAVGYEPRSLYLLKENLSSRNKENTLVLYLDRKHCTQALMDELNSKHILGIDLEYNSGKVALEEINKFIARKTSDLSINIDYSSMPRSWYCAIPQRLIRFTNVGYNIFYWYVAGDHTSEQFPTAGIEEIALFSGRANPSNNATRYHVMGIGYDRFRSEAVYSIIEPENLVICYSFNHFQNETQYQVVEKNRWLIENSFQMFEFPMNDFSGMVSKLCDMCYSLLQHGQVIIVPDGPKPLIMAMSIIPLFLGALEEDFGLTCLFIMRSKNFIPVEVQARENEVFGFRICE